MKMHKPVIPKKHRPRGFEIIHEDLDLIAVNKESGILSVAALWNSDDTVQSRLNFYIQKGNARSKKTIYVVHRLDQATSGVLIFAKSEAAQKFLKNNWSDNKKTYYALVHGIPQKKSGLIESFLEEDENYFVHSSLKKEANAKLARTEYEVVKSSAAYSLLRLNLLTGKKNQIRVHLSELGHPIVGDFKYGAPGKSKKPGEPIMLHAYSLELTHPFKKERLLLTAELPERFNKVMDCQKINVESKNE